jgi:hypothetical protein
LWPPPDEPPLEPPLEPPAKAELVTAKVKARAPSEAPEKVDQRELFIVKTSIVAERDLWNRNTHSRENTRCFRTPEPLTFRHVIPSGIDSV